MLTRASSLSKSRRDRFSNHVLPHASLAHAAQCPQEYYADYWALDGALVSLELENNVACFMPQTWESQVPGPAVAPACWVCRSSQH